MRARLDVEMVRRGLAESRSEATDLIMAGVVRVAGAVADKPARLVARAGHCCRTSTALCVSGR